MVRAPNLNFLNLGWRSGLSTRNAMRLEVSMVDYSIHGLTYAPSAPFNPKAKRRLLGTSVAEVVRRYRHAVAEMFNVHNCR